MRRAPAIERACAHPAIGESHPREVAVQVRVVYVVVLDASVFDQSYISAVPPDVPSLSARCWSEPSLGSAWRDRAQTIPICVVPVGPIHGHVIEPPAGSYSSPEPRRLARPRRYSFADHLVALDLVGILAPSTTPAANPLEGLLLRAQGRDVRTALVGSEVVVDSGRLVRFDEPTSAAELAAHLGTARFPSMWPP